MSSQLRGVVVLTEKAVLTPCLAAMVGCQLWEVSATGRVPMAAQCAANRLVMMHRSLVRFVTLEMCQAGNCR